MQLISTIERLWIGKTGYLFSFHELLIFRFLLSQILLNNYSLTTQFINITVEEYIQGFLQNQLLVTLNMNSSTYSKYNTPGLKLI